MKSFLLFGSAVSGFLLEFEKDPLPLKQQYWSMGNVDISPPSLNSTTEKPEVSISLKTIVENIKDATALDKALQNVAVGMAKTSLLEDTEKILCCDGASTASGCKDKELIITTDPKHKNDVFSTTLSEAAKGMQVLTPKPGHYTIFVANCNADDVVNTVKIVGSVKVKDNTGYMSAQEIQYSRGCFIMGFLYLTLGVVYCFFSFGVSTYRISKLISLISLVAASRLILINSYFCYDYNLTGIENGAVVTCILIGIQLFLCVVTWDHLHSQYQNSGSKMTTLDKLAMIPGCLGCMITSVNTYGYRQTRPPSEFFANPEKFTGANIDNNGLTDFFSLETLGEVFKFDMNTAFMLSGLVLLVFSLFYCERNLSSNEDTDFSKKVLTPIRATLVTFMLFTIGLLTILSFTTTASDNIFMFSLTTEGVGFGTIASIAYYIWIYNGEQTSPSYSTINKVDEVELSHIETEVENYDPDKLPETRVIE